MEEYVPMTSKELAEVFGGILTWVGTSVILFGVAWLVAVVLNWTHSNWIFSLFAIAGPCAWAVARFIERKRNA